MTTLSIKVGEGFFYHCFWMAMISSPRSRLNAWTYLHKKLGNNFSKEDIGMMIGNEPGLMVKALAQCLNDSVVLVQRNSLDFLVKYLPLDSCSNYFTNVNFLVLASLKTVLRKDMSLNRRLYTWLLDMQQELKSGQNDDTYKPILSQSARKIIVASLNVNLNNLL
jgi:hypothetical protein